MRRRNEQTTHPRFFDPRIGVKLGNHHEQTSISRAVGLPCQSTGKQGACRRKEKTTHPVSTTSECCFSFEQLRRKKQIVGQIAATKSQKTCPKSVSPDIIGKCQTQMTSRC